MTTSLHNVLCGLLPAALLAVSAAGHGDIHDQVAEVDLLLVRDPDAAPLYIRRGDLHRLDGAYERALDDYGQARALEPDAHRLDYREAETLRSAGRHPEALPLYERFLASEPGHPDAQLGRARSLAAIGRDADAVAAYDAALKAMGSPDPDILLERARVEARAMPDRLDRALAGLDEGIRVLGPVPALVAEAVALEVRRGETDRALARIDALPAGPGSGHRWLAMKADLLADAGRTGEAAAAYDQALASIEALPAHRRSTPALRERVREIKARRTELAR